MAIAIIPARGGSKRIPNKNVRDFAGKPILAWPIEAALESGCFSRVVVSTDSPVIAEIAQRFGAEAPFVRPAHLSTDTVATRPVVNHAIETLQQDTQFEEVCCIYPTAVFLDGDTLRNSLDDLRQSGSDFVFSCTSFPYPIRRALRMTEAGNLEMIWPEFRTTRSQDLEPAYHDAGQFYWGRASAFLDGRHMFGPAARPWILPRHKVQDIDTPEDWVRAELALRIISEGHLDHHQM